MGVSLGQERVKPLVNVVAFEQAVGGELAAASAVGSRVGEEDGESLREEQLCVPGHADAVVAEAVEKDYCVAVAGLRTDGPGAEDDGVWRGDGNVCQIGVQLARDIPHGGFCFWR